MVPCAGSCRPSMVAVGTMSTDAGTEESAALLGHSRTWRGPLVTANIAGAGLASKCALSRYRSNPSWMRRAIITFLLISCWACLNVAAASISLPPSPLPSPSISSSPSTSPPRSFSSHSQQPSSSSSSYAYSYSHLYPGSISSGTEEATDATLILETVIQSNTGFETESHPEQEPETLLIDTRIPVFIDGYWQIMSDEEHRELRRREAAAPKETPSPTTTTEVVIDVGSVTHSKGAAATTASASTTAITSPLPSPLEGAFAANFSTGQSCPAFINGFLSDATFKSCYPISFLLQGSTSFFEAEKSFFAITQVLDAACKADVKICTDYFRELASNLISDKNCGKEYDRQNALVLQAYIGMTTYDTVYRATCLQDADNKPNHYCFADAVTDPNTPSNAYLYYLPFNYTLPDTAVPDCGSCTRQTMEIYQAATSNRKSDITKTYPSAAEQINMGCGSNFVNITLAAVTVSGATTSLYPMPPFLLLLFTFISMTMSGWIL